MSKKQFLIALDPQYAPLQAIDSLANALDELGVSFQMVSMPDKALKLFELGASDGDPAAEYQTQKTEVLKASIAALQALCADLEGSLAVYEAHLEPVFWVCYNKNCGSPNQTPRMLFPGVTTLAVSLICTHCHWIQPHDHFAQFL